MKIDKKIIVLDDDPTGTQTVHDIPVFTGWEKDDIIKGFESSDLFYILTNSRSLTEDETISLHEEIMDNIIAAAKEKNQEILIISRSDSTLRGHFPTETEVIRGKIEDGLAIKIDGEIMCPFFKEGGRFTVGDIHLVLDGKSLIPAAETEFAKDPTFGYTKSNIKEYIEEKTKGKFKASDVISISLDELRAGDVNGVADKLMKATDFGKIIVNAVDYSDLKVFSEALAIAMSNGKNYIFRSAASIVKVLGGIADSPLLTGAEMVKEDTENGGLVVVGSYMEKTTKQLEALKELSGILEIPFDSNLVLDEEKLQTEIIRVRDTADAAIKDGKTAVIYTSRKRLALENDTKEAALKRSVRISRAVQEIVNGIKAKPAFIIAKGGITSSDIATKVLNIKCANVLGQIKPGIPVWETGEESKYPNIPYIVFPGNVGDITTLKEAAEILINR